MKKFLALLICLSPLFANAAQLNHGTLNDAAKDHLINLINIDTAQPEPKETIAVRYIYKILNANKIDWDIYRTEKARGNLIAILKADKEYAKTNPQKPLILIAHLDTAAVQDGWTLPPTKATTKDGRIFGLGSTDAKNYAAVNLTILTWLAKNNIKLNRDIIFLFTADEENGSTKGIKFLYDKYPGKLKAGFALNEGGGLIKSEDSLKDIMFVEAASKMYMDILLTAHGEAGHSSMPGQSNAIYKLSQAMTSLENSQMPFRLSQFTKTFFDRIYKYQDADAQTTISMLHSQDPNQVEQAAKIIAEDSFLKTQLTDTITPTILTSGLENNTSSAEASATLNCRLLPDTNPTEFLNRISAIFEGDESIALTVIERPELPFPQPNPESNDPLFKAIEAAVNTSMPGTLTLPGMTPASNESEFLRRHGIIAYGIGPLMERKDEGPHQADESISEKDFFDQLKLTIDIVLNFTEIKPKEEAPSEVTSVTAPVETPAAKEQPKADILPPAETFTEAPKADI